MASNGTHWASKSRFLNRVTGLAIVEEQTKINDDPNKFVVATQLEKRGDFKEIEIKKGVKEKILFYDAWIYYKDQFGNVVLPDDGKK